MFDKERIRGVLASYPQARGLIWLTLVTLETLYGTAKRAYRPQPVKKLNTVEIASLLSQTFNMTVEGVQVLSISRPPKMTVVETGETVAGLIPVSIGYRTSELLIREWERADLDRRLEAIGALNAFRCVQFHSEIFWVDSPYELGVSNFNFIPIAVGMLLKYALLGDEKNVERHVQFIQLLSRAVPVGTKAEEKRTWLVLTA